MRRRFGVPVARGPVAGGPLRSAAFRRLWAASTVTALGSQLTVVAVPLQIYALTGSSSFVGLAGLVGFLPMAVGALWGGSVADARDRRLVLLATNAGIGVTSLLLCAQAYADLRSVGVLLALVAVQQALFGANAATGGAVVPRLVPADLLPAAIGLQSAVLGSAGILGPLLAGALLPVVGLPTLYLADAVALCATLRAVWRLPALPPAGSRTGNGNGAGAGDGDGDGDRAGGTRRAGLRQIADGFRLLATHPVLLPAYLADFAALFLGMPAALFPQLAQQSYGASAIGVLYAALSVGGVLAGLSAGLLTRTRRHGAALATAVCGWGLAVAAFGCARSLVPAAGLLVLAGGGLAVLSVFRKALLQTVATDEMRGRLQGADTVVAAGGPRLAGFAHGAAGAAFGARWTVTAGGLLTLTAALALLAAFPAFRRYRTPPATPERQPANRVTNLI